MDLNEARNYFIDCKSNYKLKTNQSLTKYISNNVYNQLKLAYEHLNTDDSHNSLTISEGKENRDNGSNSNSNNISNDHRRRFEKSNVSNKNNS